MPFFERPSVSLYYERIGEGFPVLLFAPGGMRSSIPLWERPSWDPRVELAGEFSLILMDQRNAGRSTATITAADSWTTYASDHVALLDHLGVERCHVLGGCIGGAFCLGLIHAAPERVSAAVLQQPIGLSPENRDVFFELFDSWAAEIRPNHPEATEDDFRSFRENMYGGDFTFSVSRDFVASCPTPLLVLLGDDIYHPSDVSREIVDLAPCAELVEKWKEAGSVGDAVRKVRTFLHRHSAR